ncbi:ImmA/IrrE family metallo-endopeptidase [Bacterioplanoides pacificum]|uniref:ImmA/IrrE family metallo-endopeptidase n=1 Tax=Bacterioplanoides pacificum TaxID=1171596 RepID=A0ABV7VNJ3_9GAMM
MAAIVPPKDLNEIRVTADEVKNIIGAWTRDVFPVMELIEAYDGFSVRSKGEHLLEIVSKEEMPYSSGQTCTKSGLIKLREDYYMDACDGNCEGRFTAAHELGHHILHKGVTLQRVADGIELPADYCPEVQADSFACELLIDHEYLKQNLGKHGLAAIAERYRLPVQKLFEHVQRLMENGELAAIQLEMKFS